jgi:hypothetical protein
VLGPRQDGVRRESARNCGRQYHWEVGTGTRLPMRIPPAVAGYARCCSLDHITGGLRTAITIVVFCRRRSTQIRGQTNGFYATHRREAGPNQPTSGVGGSEPQQRRTIEKERDAGYQEDHIKCETNNKERSRAKRIAVNTPRT